MRKQRRLLNVRPGVRFMSDTLADRIKELAMRMLEENREYPVVLEWVSHVLVSIQDLDHYTALEIVERLLLDRSIRRCPGHSLDCDILFVL